MAAVSERDRGQLIIVAGLGLAVALVALALVLNSAIYTQNLASRNLESGAGDAVDARHDVVVGVGGLMDSVNDPTTDYGTLETEYQDAVVDWNVGAGQFGALRGQSVRVETATDGAGSPIISHGVRVVDGDDTTTFHPRDGTTTDWTVASDVRVRNFRMTVTGVSAAPSDSGVEDELDDGTWTEGLFFYVDVDDGRWRMAVYGDGSGNVKVGVYDGSTGEYGVCSITPAATPARIDVGRGTVNNVPCEALESVGGQTGPYTVHYANADQVTGSYELTADRVIEGTSSEVGAFTDETDRINYGNHCDGPTYHGSGGGNPYVAPALYSSEADVSFGDGSVSYDSTVRVAADELSEGASSPSVAVFTVDDQSDTALSDPAKFEINWQVADPDGDLSSVAVELINSGTVKDSATDSSVADRTASGSFVLRDGLSLPATYDIEITVTDAEGNARTVTQTHEAESGGDDSGCPP